MTSATFIDSLPAEKSAAIHALFSPWATDRTPGAVAGVMRAGKPVFAAAWGMADLAFGIPLDNRSVMRIASQSKQFTVLLTLMMEAEGRLSLSDDLRDHCPWMPDFGVPVTLRQMASNTSGLADILDTMITTGVPIVAPSSRDAARQIVSRHRHLNFAPGTDLLYSNTNFLLLTEILEKVSGRSYCELLRERITGPLGMDSTRLMVRDDEILPRLAGHHRRGPGGEWLRAAWGIAIGGEGGLVSSLDDMLRWHANLRNPVVGTADMIARMRDPGIVINGHRSPYGLGLVTTTHRGRACIGHGGWIAGARSESFWMPDADLTITVEANHDDLSPFLIARAIADIMLDLPPAPAVSAGGASAIERAAGLYREAGGGRMMSLSLTGGKPVMVSNLGESALEEVAPGRFRALAAIPRYAFELAADGRILADSYGRRIAFRPVSRAPKAPARAAAGRYASDEAGLHAELVLDDAGMRLRTTSELGGDHLRLVQCDDDLFIARPMSDEPHDAWRSAPWVLPWLYSVQLRDGMLVLNSDRGAELALRRV